MSDYALTPEQAQKQTEENWERRAEHGLFAGKCGWCEFASQQIVTLGDPRTERQCDYCPVLRVLPSELRIADSFSYCETLTVIRSWRSSKTILQARRTAQAVFALAVKYREELIAEGKKIGGHRINSTYCVSCSVHRKNRPKAEEDGLYPSSLPVGGFWWSRS